MTTEIERQLVQAIQTFLVAEADARAERIKRLVEDDGGSDADRQHAIRIEHRQLHREWGDVCEAIRALTDRDRVAYGAVADLLARLRAGIDAPASIVWAVRSSVTHSGVLASRLEYWEREVRKARAP